MLAERFDAVIDMICFDGEDAVSSLKAFRGRVEHFVHCSTVMTYGLPFAGINLDETASLNGISKYAFGEISADELFLRAYLEEDFPVTIFKPPLTFGGRRWELDPPTPARGANTIRWRWFELFPVSPPSTQQPLSRQYSAESKV